MLKSGMTILITGGARSGKSQYAENLLKDKNEAVYIATAEVFDDEMRQRIKIHTERRNKNWRTAELFKNLTSAVGKEKHYLLDCVTNMISRILFEQTKDCKKIERHAVNYTAEIAVREIKNLAKKIGEEKGHLVIVTNEVGSSIVPMDNLSRAFRDIQGIVNAEIAAFSDEVVMTVCGLPVFLKNPGKPIIL